MDEEGIFGNLGAARSISDDDLCASCMFLLYCPGQLSVCSKATIDKHYEWPGFSDEDGYVISCGEYILCNQGENLVVRKE